MNCDLIFDAEMRERTGQRVLIVDDELDLYWAHAIKKLVRAGYEVGSARDGEEGWGAVRGNRYDLLITDNRMPRLSGLELIEKIRSEHLPMPVILASTLLPSNELKRKPHLKIDSTLEKPVGPSELLSIVERIFHTVRALAPC
jgi:DNA-binding NtrC family response regulator